MDKNEQYRTTVRYYSVRAKKDQKYITIELPVDSVFQVNDRVEISIFPAKEKFTTTITGGEEIRLTAGSIMRQMDVGDTATFSYENWLTVRTVASQIKEMYGSVFRVQRDKHRPENIIVTRLK